MFTLIALLLTVWGISSKSDVRDAIQDMKSDMRDVASDLQGKVNKATDDMNKNFQALAGESLKRPLLTIANGTGLLDGQTFKVRGPVAIFPLFIKNEGDKKSGALSIRLFASNDLNLSTDNEWERLPSNNPDYPFVYYYHYMATALGSPDISPQETWTLLSDTQLQPLNYVNGKVTCKIDVFYDAEKPAEAKFTLQL